MRRHERGLPKNEARVSPNCRADGPTVANVEKPKSVNNGIDVEKPKREAAPVQRLVRPVSSLFNLENHHRLGRQLNEHAFFFNPCACESGWFDCLSLGESVVGPHVFGG